MANHPAITSGRTAVITGAASGIGLAAARAFAGLGLKVVMGDLKGERLDAAAAEVAGLARGGPAHVRALAVDVGSFEQVEALRDLALDAYGDIAVVMNNAAIAPGPGKPWEDLERWRAVIQANLWGVVHGVHAFTPTLIAQAAPSAMVNTGSKQGITNPPGGTAYNVSKAGVKTLTEQLSFALATEAPQVSAHLLVPGFTFTGMSGGGAAAEKHPGAWTADQVAAFMLEGMAKGDFYILCPDNMVTRAVDERRMQWSAGDLIENRPALSRWRPEFKDAFDDFMR